MCTESVHMCEYGVCVHMNVVCVCTMCVCVHVCVCGCVCAQWVSVCRRAYTRVCGE